MGFLSYEFFISATKLHTSTYTAQVKQSSFCTMLLFVVRLITRKDRSQSL